MKSVLITGANSGLGRGLSLAYANEDTHLCLVARREAELESVANECRILGATATTVVADVVDTARMVEVIGSFAKECGQLDLVIANAGIGEGRKGERFDSEKVARVIDVNLKGLANTLLPAVDIMRNQGHGTLVGMASVASYRAVPGSLAYSASKAGVLTFMEGLEIELKHAGVHAMSLCPGFIRTPLTDRNDFSMPFIIECDDACARMKKAIDARRSRYTFPLPYFLAAQLMRVAPHWLLRKLSPAAPERRG